MSLKRIGIVLGVVMALSAVIVSSAWATVAETPAGGSRWYVNGKALPTTSPVTSAPVTCKATTETTGLEFKATLLGLPVKMTATGVECIGHTETAGEKARIQNTETVAGTKWAAEDFGRLRFTGVQVVEPAKCKAPSTTTTTNPLISEIYEEKEGATVKAVTDRFEPTEIEGKKVFINIALEDKSATETCPVANPKVPVTGVSYGLAEREIEEGGKKVIVNQITGNEEVIQRLRFDEGVDETATAAVGFEKSATLKLGGNPAHLMGTVDNELVSKEKFGAKEK